MFGTPNFLSRFPRPSHVSHTSLLAGERYDQFGPGPHQMLKRFVQQGRSERGGEAYASVR